MTISRDKKIKILENEKTTNKKMRISQSIQHEIFFRWF